MDQHEARPAPRPKTIQPSSGVKVEPAHHGANLFELRYSGEGFARTPTVLLQKSCQVKDMRSNKLIQTSFENFNAFSKNLSTSNGLVDAVFKAYNGHYHLVVRPEDVWFTILVQVCTL